MKISKSSESVVTWSIPRDLYEKNLELIPEKMFEKIPEGIEKKREAVNSYSPEGCIPLGTLKEILEQIFGEIPGESFKAISKTPGEIPEDICGKQTWRILGESPEELLKVFLKDLPEEKKSGRIPGDIPDEIS